MISPMSRGMQNRSMSVHGKYLSQTNCGGLYESNKSQNNYFLEILPVCSVMQSKTHEITRGFYSTTKVESSLKLIKFHLATSSSREVVYFLIMN